MIRVSLAKARVRLDEHLDEAAAGREAIITRRGKAVARLITAVRPTNPLPLRELAGSRATMPSSGRSAAELVREVRDERY